MVEDQNRVSINGKQLHPRIVGKATLWTLF
jgi:hypothetical protein